MWITLSGPPIGGTEECLSPTPISASVFLSLETSLSRVLVYEVTLCSEDRRRPTDLDQCTDMEGVSPILHEKKKKLI